MTCPEPFMNTYMEQFDKHQLCETDAMENGNAETAVGTTKPYDNVFSSATMNWDAQKRNASRCNFITIFGVFLLSLSVALLIGIIVIRVHQYGSIAKMDQQQEQLSSYEGVINNLTGRLEDIENSRDGDSDATTTDSTMTSMTGTTYVRWGRTVCPDTADLVYKGFAAGGKGGIDIPGGGANYLCMPESPVYKFTAADKQESRSRIFGSEYRNWPGDHGAMTSQHGHDVPCAVCQTKEGRSQTLMIPATTECPTGWTVEYPGYLSAAKFDHARSEYVCADMDPEILPGSTSQESISFFYQVEGICTPDSTGGLACGPYEDGWELTCAVCSM